MRVSHRGRNTHVAEERLHEIQRNSFHRQLRRKRVAQRVCGDPAKAGFGAYLCQPVVETGAVEGLVVVRIHEHVPRALLSLEEHLVHVRIKWDVPVAITLWRVQHPTRIVV